MGKADEAGEYVLGTDAEELRRLGLQHQLWRAEMFAAFARAGFGPGMRLVDLGAGPGYTSRDLAELVGESGTVTAVDMSERFLASLAETAHERGLTQLRTVRADVQELRLPEASFDGAYARWVFCFVPEPARVLAGLASALKPGAVVCIQDYVDYATLSLLPRSAAFTRIVQAVDQSWRARGGDPDVVARLPRLLGEQGFTLRELRPITRMARSSEPLWRWPDSFFRNYVPILQERGLVSAAEAAAFWHDFDACAADPHGAFISPVMGELIAVRR